MIVQSRQVWIAGQFVPAQLELENGVIARVLPYNYNRQEAGNGEDYGDLRLVPGFVDIHTHGAYGFDATEAEPEGLLFWAKNAAREGITSFLATTVTQSDDVLSGALQNIRRAAACQQEGAQIIGIHMEGPYLCQKYKGAQPAEHIVKASARQFDRWMELSGGMIRLMTVAPEEDGDFAFIRHCASKGVAVNMGHTGCTYDQALLAFANGVTGVTHTHNAMSPYSHRDLGVVNAALSCRDIYCEIIGDGIHVQFPVISSFFDCKGFDRAIMVTDSLLVKGAEAKAYSFGGHSITLREEGGAVLTGTNTLAGSTLKTNEGLRNLVEKARIPFGAALNACTINPARHIRVDDRKGKIAAGYDADLVVLGNDYRIIQTYCRGRPEAGFKHG